MTTPNTLHTHSPQTNSSSTPSTAASTIVQHSSPLAASSSPLPARSLTEPWLLLDTSMPRAVLGIWSPLDNTMRAEATVHDLRRHDHHLSNAVGKLLDGFGLRASDLGGVAVGAGPGSFIGVRVALSLGKGIAIAAGIPLVGVSSLAALAYHPLPMGLGWAVIDAYKGELYAQRVQRTRNSDGDIVVTAFDTPQTVEPAQLAPLVDRMAFFVGNGLGHIWPEASWPQHFFPVEGPAALGIAGQLQDKINDVARNEVLTAVPNYIRPPDAKLPNDPS